MKEPRMGKTGLFDGGGSEPDDWITVDNGSHIPLENGQSKASAIKEHFESSKKTVTLSKQEYAILCSIVKTKYKNNIPRQGGVFDSKSYLRYNYNSKLNKIVCTVKLDIEQDTETISIVREIYGYDD